MTQDTAKSQRHRSDDDRRAEFVALATKWRSETAHLSSVTQIAMHPAYQRIIGMGRDVIPFVLEDLRDNGGHWYWALQSLTGETPVPDDAAGNVREMKAAWLQWGSESGYIEGA